MKLLPAFLPRPISALIALVLFISVASCSGSKDNEAKFDKALTQQLIKEYDANGGKLSPEQYSELIKNTRILFSCIKEEMKDLMDISEPLKFTQEYQRLKNDNDFIERLTLREQAWRVLVLGQKDFSVDNRKEFGNLPDECTIIDYYDDCIRTRVTDAE